MKILKISWMITCVLLGVALLWYFFTSSGENIYSKNYWLQANTGVSQLTPISSNASVEGEVYSLIFEGLVSWDQNGNMVPRLAKELPKVSEEIILAPIPSFPDALSLSDITKKINESKIAEIEKVQDIDVDMSITFPKEFYPGYQKFINKTNKEEKVKAVKIICRKPGIDLSLFPGEKEGVMVAARPVLLFSLKENVFFHDWINKNGQVVSGQKVSSEDVIFSIMQYFSFDNPIDENLGLEPNLTFSCQKNKDMMKKAFINPNTLNNLQYIAKIRKIDANQVEATLSVRTYKYLSIFTVEILPHYLITQLLPGYKENSIAPKEWHGSYYQTLHPSGTGPFQIEKNEVKKLIILKSFPLYHGPKPKFTKAIFRIISYRETEKQEFDKEKLDVYRPEPVEIAHYQNSTKNLLELKPSMDDRYTFLAYNMRRPLFQGTQQEAIDNQKQGWRVRRALTLAVDIDFFISNMMYGMGTRLNGPFHPAAPWNDGNICPTHYNSQESRELLKLAGYSWDSKGLLIDQEGKHLTIEIATSTRNPLWIQLMNYVIESWKKLGVVAIPNTLEWLQYIQTKIEPYNFDTCIIAIELNPIEESMLENMWHSKSSQKPGGYNISNFLQCDSLIEKIQTCMDSEKRNSLILQAHRLIAAENPYLFCFMHNRTAVLHPNTGTIDSNGKFVKIDAFPPVDFYYSGFYSWQKQ